MEEKSKDAFIPYIPGQVDKETQEKEKISKLEELILKPVREGLDSLTKDEVERYLEIDIDELRKIEIGMEITVVCMAAQEIIKKGKKSILKSIEEKEKAEKEGESR